MLIDSNDRCSIAAVVISSNGISKPDKSCFGALILMDVIWTLCVSFSFLMFSSDVVTSGCGRTFGLMGTGVLTSERVLFVSTVCVGLGVNEVVDGVVFERAVGGVSGCVANE